MLVTLPVGWQLRIFIEPFAGVRMTVAGISAALGGISSLGTSIVSEFDLADAAMAGLTPESATNLVRSGLLKADELYALVIPRRTLDRRVEAKQSLTVAESDRLLRAVRVIVRAGDALGSTAKAAVWLRTPNAALRGRTPISMLETDLGARMVERTLGRIEQGVHS